MIRSILALSLLLAGSSTAFAGGFSHPTSGGATAMATCVGGYVGPWGSPCNYGPLERRSIPLLVIQRQGLRFGARPSSGFRGGLNSRGVGGQRRR